ncbi:ribulose-1,5-bisphosphate carboxylase/oxygenase large subunit [Striga asiatica]|uniref:Ribulose bisphosphate carboxylase large chain n=1 Tax=Striga asiatica TaxID=4170 RepID=A0A5A7NXR5_STRAF|nr:ribulose-1,5-bisphosphate carboxylase/oxygenase large subunit [Striga asiatica]
MDVEALTPENLCLTIANNQEPNRKATSTTKTWKRQPKAEGRLSRQQGIVLKQDESVEVKKRKDGINTRILKDPWIQKLKSRKPHFKNESLQHPTMVSELLEEGGRSWNIELLKELFDDSIKHGLAGTLVPQPETFSVAGPSGSSSGSGGPEPKGLKQNFNPDETPFACAAAFLSPYRACADILCGIYLQR